VTSRLLAILARFADAPDIEPDTIDLSAPVFGPSGVITDSLRVLDALCQIEEGLDVDIPDEDLTEDLFASVRNFALYLQARLGASEVA
jgi:acyl carrier protein